MPVLGDVRFNNYAQLNLFFKVKDPGKLYDCPVREVPLVPYPEIAKSYFSSTKHTSRIVCGEQYYDHSSRLTYADSGLYPTKSEACLYFDGKYIYVQNPDGVTYAFNNAIYTIDMYIACANKQDEAVILYKGHTDAESQSGNMKLFVKDGNIFFSVLEYVSDTSYVWHTRCWDAINISMSPANGMTHIAVVKENNKYPQLYVNGILQPDCTPAVPLDRYHNLHTGTPADSAEAAYFNVKTSCSRVTIGGEAGYDITDHSCAVAYLFQGWLKDVCVRRIAKWTSNFTPPQSAPSVGETTTPSGSTKAVDFLVRFQSRNDNRIFESAKEIYLTTPVFAEEMKTVKMGNAKYAVFFPADTNSGMALNNPNIAWSEIKHTDDGITVECTAYGLKQDTLNNNRCMLSYEVVSGSGSSVVTFHIKRLHSSNNFPVASYGYNACVQFGYCSGTKNVTDHSCIDGWHNYCISYDAYTGKAYFYIDNLYVGQVLRSTGGWTREQQRLCIGFSSKLGQSGFGGYIGQVKVYSYYCKYNKAETLVNVLSNYETWMLLYNVKVNDKKRIYAIELTYEKDTSTRANLLKVYDTHNFLRVRLQTSNGNSCIYWAPLVSYYSTKASTWHPFYSQLKVIHPNGNRCMVMGCPSQKAKPNIFVANDYNKKIESQQQWCMVHRTNNTFRYVYDEDSPCYAPRIGTGSPAKYYCKFGSYSFDLSLKPGAKIVCDHTDIFNLQDGWTIDFFYWLTANATSSTVATPIVDLFGAIGISPGGIFFYRYDNYDGCDYLYTSTSNFPLNKWCHTAVSYIKDTGFKIYRDGQAISGGSCIGTYGAIVTASKMYKMNDAGINLLVRRNNDIIIGRQRMDCYLDSLRIRREATNALSTFNVPTEVNTSSSRETDFAYLNFDDLKE